MAVSMSPYDCYHNSILIVNGHSSGCYARTTLAPSAKVSPSPYIWNYDAVWSFTRLSISVFPARAFCIGFTGDLVSIWTRRHRSYEPIFLHDYASL